jgi:formiminotetrahydrofolate cyclodeaminase
MKKKYLLIAMILILTNCKSHKIYTEQELENIKKTERLRNEMMNDYENDQREFNEELNNQN